MIWDLHRTLQENCQLDPSLPVLVGVSGGPDSVCLLQVLLENGYQPVVAHLDHGLRPESAEERLQVEQLAANLGLPCYSTRQDVTAFGREKGYSLEHAARVARYRFLFEAAYQSHAQAVAVGHTADDQVETLLLHLLRGAGMNGLSAMRFYRLPNPWSDRLPLVRPLLATSRSTVLEFLAKSGLRSIEDTSNQDWRYTRNRVRHELIPLLETYNPQVRMALWRTAQLLADEQETLALLAKNALAVCLRESGPGYRAVDRTALRTQPLAIQRLLLLHIMTELRPGVPEIDYATVHKALIFIDNPSRSGMTNLAAGLHLFIEADVLWLAAWEADLPHMNWPQIVQHTELVLPEAGTIYLSGGWRLVITKPPNKAELFQLAQNNPDPFTAYLDADQIQGPLFLRARRAGDRYQPMGLSGHSQKISDLFVNVHVPRRARPGWPLLCCGNKIVWVPGFRLAGGFELTPATQTILKISLTHE